MDKTLKDLKVGDTVYLWGKCDANIKTDKVKSIKKDAIDDNAYVVTYEGHNSASSCTVSSRSGNLGMYACAVYFSKEALIEEINDHIKKLQTLCKEINK